MNPRGTYMGLLSTGLPTGLPASPEVIVGQEAQRFDRFDQPLARPTHLLPKASGPPATEPKSFTWGTLQPPAPPKRRAPPPPAPGQPTKFDWVKMIPPKKLV